MRMLYFEKYVVMRFNTENLLFFNLINGTILKYNLTLDIFKILKKETNNCIPINEAQCQNKLINVVARDLKNNFMGGFIVSNSFPFIRPDMLYTDWFPQYLEKGKLMHGGDSITQSLRKLIVHLDKIPFQKETFYYNASRQIDFLPLETGNHHEKTINLNVIKNTFFNTNFNNLIQIQFFCNSISKHGLEILSFTEIRPMKDLFVEIFIFFNDFIRELDIINNKKYNSLIFKPIIFRDFKENINRFLKYKLNFKKNIIPVFLIREEQDIKTIEEFESDLDKIELEVYPYFFNNYNFLQQNVFLNKNSFNNRSYRYNEILKNDLLNASFFGKLIIEANGDILTSRNTGIIGNIFKNKIKEILIKEINNPQTWRLLRANVKPCKKCIYSSFCSPISYLEIEMNKYNLCSLSSNNF